MTSWPISVIIGRNSYSDPCSNAIYSQVSGVNIYHTWYHSKGHFIAVSLTPLSSARNVLHALKALLRNA